VAYPAYTRFLSDAKAKEAQAVIGAMAAAMKAARQSTATPSFAEITPLTPAAGTWVDITTDTDGDGVADGIYTIGTVQVDTGEGDSFRYRINNTLSATTFAIRAEGRNDDDDGLVDNDDSLVYSYDAQGNPRATWTAGGSLSAP
jgi:type II secretory pathway pseudopilin PulG